MKSAGKNFLFIVFKNCPNKKFNSESGQSFVEFVLLMLVIISISYGYVAMVHTNLGTHWEKMVNVVINNDGTNFKDKVKY